MSEVKLVYPADYPRYTRGELLQLCRRGVRRPSGMPAFKAWFGDIPPQTTSPLTSKRSPRPPHASISSSSYTTNPESSGRARTGNRRATSPGGTFTRERAPHARDGGGDRERTTASGEFKNPFSASASGPGAMRMGNFTHRAGRNGEDGETLGLKKLADSYDRTKTNSIDLNGSSSRTGEAGRRTGTLTGLDGVVRGGRGDRERDGARTEKTMTPRKEGEIEGRAERSERLEKERAERKAERSEDWRRGASQLPSRPPPTTTSSSSSLPSGPGTPNGLSTTPSRVPGRPAWNPAPTTDSPSRTSIRDRDDRGGRHDGHHRRDRGDDDDGSVPAWAAEETKTPATSKLGGFGADAEKEDEIQRFKREMKERDLRASGGSRRDDSKESIATPAEVPSSLSIGGIQIPVHANSPVVAPTRPDMPPSTSSSTSVQSVVLPQPAGLPSPAADDAAPAGGRRGGSRFAKFFADGKPKAESSPLASPATPSDGGGNLGALLGGMALGGGGGQAGGAPGDNQMSKLLAMLQSSKPGDPPRASPLQQHASYLQSPSVQSPAPAPSTLAPASYLAAPSPNVRQNSHSPSIPSDSQQQYLHQQQQINQLRPSPAPSSVLPTSPMPPPSQQQPQPYQPSPAQTFNSPLYPHQQHHPLSPPSNYAQSPSASAHLLHTLSGGGGGPQHQQAPPRSYLSPPPSHGSPVNKPLDPYEQAQRLQQIIEAQHQQRGGAPLPPGMGGAGAGARQPAPPPQQAQQQQQWNGAGGGAGGAGMDMLRGMMQQPPPQLRGYGGPTGPARGGYEQTYGGGGYGGPQQGHQQMLLQQQQQQILMQQQQYGQYNGGSGGGGAGGGGMPPHDLMSLLMHGQGGGRSPGA